MLPWRGKIAINKNMQQKIAAAERQRCISHIVYAALLFFRSHWLAWFESCTNISIKSGGWMGTHPIAEREEFDSGFPLRWFRGKSRPNFGTLHIRSWSLQLELLYSAITICWRHSTLCRNTWTICSWSRAPCQSYARLRGPRRQKYPDGSKPHPSHLFQTFPLLPQEYFARITHPKRF